MTLILKRLWLVITPLTLAACYEASYKTLSTTAASTTAIERSISGANDSGLRNDSNAYFSDGSGVYSDQRQINMTNQYSNAGDLSSLVGGLHNRLITSTPEDIGGWVLLAKTYQMLQQPSKAIDALHQGLKSNPGNPKLTQSLQQFYSAQAAADPSQRVPATALAQAMRQPRSGLLSPEFERLLQKSLHRSEP